MRHAGEANAPSSMRSSDKLSSCGHGRICTLDFFCAQDQTLTIWFLILEPDPGHGGSGVEEFTVEP